MKKYFTLMLLLCMQLLWISSVSGNDEIEKIKVQAKITTGDGYILTLKDDGTVWAWGNYYGIFDDDKKPKRDKPSQVAELTNVMDISAGTFYSLVLKKDGTVWSSGQNTTGQLGNDKDKTIWRQWGKEHKDFISIAAGRNYSVALTKDGTVLTCGSNEYGQLGNVSQEVTYKTTPVIVSDVKGISGISAGRIQTIALKKDGTVLAWGDYNATQDYMGSGGVVTGKDAGTGSNFSSSYGGIAKTNFKNKPVQVANLDRIVSVAAGARHTVAIKNNGTVWAWGDNDYGQLGNGMYRPDETPYQVSGVTDVVAAAAGGSHTVVLKKDGTVWAWGNNSFGQLGDGTTKERLTPVQVSGLTDIIAVSAYSMEDMKTVCNAYTVALKKDGSLWFCGYDMDGYLVSGGTAIYKTAVQISRIDLIDETTLAETETVSAADKKPEMENLITMDGILRLIKAEPTKKEYYYKAGELFTANNETGIRVFLNGSLLDFSKYNNVQPEIINNRTMVPIAAITEGMGADIYFDEKLKNITISMGESSVKLKIDSNIAFINGEKVTLDVPAKIVNGRTLVPLSFIARCFGKTVNWYPFSEGNGVNVISIF
ncbi:MAG: hypothetical protein HGA22_02950 [Clostridiales bacterium]|nr:hypothetical protein [Clostridiales bacterium]